MAIRFQCPSCQQPIEVDDAWGGQAVACPYCRNVVTAPTTSQWPPADIPVASRVDPATIDHEPGKMPTAQATMDSWRPTGAAVRGNRAVWAFVCSLGAAALCCIAGLTFIFHVLAVAQEQLGPNATVEELQRKAEELMSTPRAVPFPRPTIFLFFGGIILGLASLWLAVQALVHQESRRVLAILACMVSVCFTFCQVMMMLAALASRGAMLRQ